MKIKFLLALSGIFAFLLISSTANAIPTFARKTGIACSYCHVAWPQLNNIGRAYKAAGYRLPDEVGEDSGNFLEEGQFPFSAVLTARPYDKKGSGKEKIRALHEVEVIAGVALGTHISGFFEFESEDETDFDVRVVEAVMTYQVNPQLNIQVSWGDMFFADPYGLLSNHFRLTRGHVGVIDQTYGGADGKVRFQRQNVTAYGRVADRVFYMVGYSGNAKDSQGVDASNILGRVAFEVTPNIMIGGFWLEGENSVTNRQYRRAGFDFLADIQDFRIGAAYIKGKDDTPDMLSEVTNDAWSVQLMYFFKTDSGRPLFVPTLRLDRYQKNNGMDQYSEATVNLTFYATEFAKVYVEYWNRFDVPVNKKEDTRLTLQASIAF